MAWYTLIILFFAGAFFTNSIPHFVMGISGRKLPTPFAHPPGRGLSSPMVNMLWGFVNFIISSILFLLVKTYQFGFNYGSLAILLGAFFIAFTLAKNFGKLKC